MPRPKKYDSAFYLRIGSKDLQMIRHAAFIMETTVSSLLRDSLDWDFFQRIMDARKKSGEGGDDTNGTP